MSVQVSPPARKPREGGIKAVVGDFIPESRLSVSQGGIAWEDGTCGQPSRTRAGCYDTTISPGTNEVQRLTVTGTPTAGNLKLVFDGETTGNIPFNASAATIQTAIDALPNVNEGDITVGGGPLPGSFVTFTFGDAYDYEDVPQMTVAAGSPALSGGTAPAGAVTTTTPGVRPTKTLDGVDQYTSILDTPFAVYKGVQCFLGGDEDGDSYESQARAGLEAWEDREAESELWTWGLAASSPGTAANIARAISLAEDYADANYVGRPVILMSRRYTSKADLKNVDGLLTTVNGTPVIAVGGITASDTDVVVVVGMPAVYASPIRTYTAPDVRTNVMMALAERVLDIAVDCDFRYAVTATTP